MPTVKRPCVQCKEKHVKCDEGEPKCHRCQNKSLPCTRPAIKTVFRHGAGVSFSKDQRWVSSEARQFRVHAHGGAATRESPGSSRETSRKKRSHSGGSPAARSDDGHPGQPSSGPSATQSPMDTDTEAASYQNDPFLGPILSSRVARASGSNHGSITSPTVLPPIPYVTGSNPLSPLSPLLYERHVEPRSTPSLHSVFHNPPGVPVSNLAPSRPSSNSSCRFPLEDVQEACLLRYFVEEISHWFDLCDEQRHFQLVVPLRARHHPHLLNAIFAVAARHLSRVPEYKTPQGILYQGQLLPHLSQDDAVEYMLKCIPALRQFHDAQDDDYLDSIITTAVILRQLEEIDDEDDGTDHAGSPGPGGLQFGPEKKVNFLAIIDAVLRSPPSQTMFGRRSLIQASYWMALRQEIYHSFTRKEPPTLILAPEYWQSASKANKTVMHTVQVAKWRWGDSSEQEWLRLMDQQEHLERDVLVDFQPTFRQPANKAKGEIFPTLWYGSNIEIASMQLSLISKSVLVAENPLLRAPSTPRASVRKVENEVRVLLLELCAIALCHPACPPAFVNAAIGIQLYEDFFTDQYERQALRTVVERYQDAHAWPVRRLLEMLR